MKAWKHLIRMRVQAVRPNRAGPAQGRNDIPRHPFIHFHSHSASSVSDGSLSRSLPTTFATVPRPSYTSRSRGGEGSLPPMVPEGLSPRPLKLAALVSVTAGRVGLLHRTYCGYEPEEVQYGQVNTTRTRHWITDRETRQYDMILCRKYANRAHVQFTYQKSTN